jgi:predicted nucleotide-binding protein (sugar kinase/HSP70/actin superfamily)
LHTAKQPILGIPRLGTTIVPLKSLFRGIGAQMELGPAVSSHTITLGARSSPEFICTPYKQLLGNMIEMLDAGADTLLYVDGLDMCRNSSYHQLLRDAMHDLGYKFQLITFSQLYKGGAFALPKFLSQFTPNVTWRLVLREFRLALGKMTALDDIERRVQFIRPREIDQGAVDKIGDLALTRLDEVIDFADLQPTVRDINQKIDAVPVDPTRRPVRVATTGEYYAILDLFYNLDRLWCMKAATDAGLRIISSGSSDFVTIGHS